MQKKIRRKYKIPKSDIRPIQKNIIKNKFKIPTKTENGPQLLGSGWDQANILKSRGEEFDTKDLYIVSSAIMQYIFEKELSDPGRSWQDYIFTQRLLHRVVQDQIAQRVKSGDPYLLAQMKTIYSNFPDIAISKLEHKAIKNFIDESKKSGKNLEFKDIAKFIFKTCNIDFDVENLKSRNLLNDLDKQKENLVKLNKDRLIGIIEGVIAGLIAAGLFELLKRALASLVMRAPYTEAQIYEVECDVYRIYDNWHKASKSSFEEIEDLNNRDKEILLDFILHSLVVSSVYGVSLRDSPICRQLEK